MTSTEAWIDGADFLGFVRREEEDLLRTAVLVRADLPRAVQLVEDALVVVGRRWAQAVDEDPGADARRHLYRTAVTEANRDGTRAGATATLGGGAGDPDWAQRPRTEEHEQRRHAVGRALGGLTARQRAVLCLLALDRVGVGEAATTLRVLPRTVRSDARAALSSLARDLPGENLRDGRADGPVVRWLLESVVAEVPAPDLAEPAARRAGGDRRSVRRRGVLVAGGVVAAGALAATVTRWVGRVPSSDRLPTPESPLLTSRTLDGVVVLLAPSPEEEVLLPLAADRGALGVPEPVGPGDPQDVRRLPKGGLGGSVLAVYLVHRDRNVFEPVVQVPDVDGRSARWVAPVTVEVSENPLGTALGPRSIDEGRSRVVLPSATRFVVVDVSTGVVTELGVPDPTLQVTGWTPGGRGIVGLGRDYGWLADPVAGTVTRAEQPVYPGRHELAWDGATTLVRTFDDAGVLAEQQRVAGPSVVPFGLTASSAGGWVASHAFLPGRYQEEAGRSQGVVAVHAGGAEPVRVLAASFPAGSTAIRYRVLRWAGEGVLLVESTGEARAGTARRVLLWDVVGDRLHRVVDVVGVGPAGSWFTGLWGT